MDVAFLISQRLNELGLDQKDLARAAHVTESYISQILTRRRTPPVPNRTDIYDKMDRFLKLPSGELGKLADLERKVELKRELGDEPTPLFREVRELILRKCSRERVALIRSIFEREPFGELERLVTQKLLDVTKRVAKAELQNKYWLRMVARLGRRSYEEMRVIVLEFLDTDILHLSAAHCVAFLEPLIESWDMDLATFSLELVLNRKVTPGNVKRFTFVERESDQPLAQEPGLTAFLRDPAMRGTVTDEELAFLKQLAFTGRRPTALYYYRELQNLRDPLHFAPSEHKKTRA